MQASGDDGVQKILRQRAEKLARVEASEQGETEATLEFLLGVERYSLPLSQVAEILRLQHVTPIPGCADELIGAVFVRGEAYCVMHTAKLIGLATPSDKPLSGYIVLVWFGGRKVGFQVDHVSHISLQPKMDLDSNDANNSFGVNGTYTLGITDGAVSAVNLDAVFAHRVFATKG